jgi:hypothetical protein
MDIALHCTVMCPNQQKAEISPDAWWTTIQCPVLNIGWWPQIGHDFKPQTGPRLTHRNKSFFHRSFQMKFFSLVTGNDISAFLIHHIRFRVNFTPLCLPAFVRLSGFDRFALCALLASGHQTAQMKRHNWTLRSLAHSFIHSLVVLSYYFFYTDWTTLFLTSVNLWEWVSEWRTIPHSGDRIPTELLKI